MNFGKALTWNELADIYDKGHYSEARPARTLPMELIFDWAKSQTDKFYIHPEEETIHKIIVNN